MLTHRALISVVSSQLVYMQDPWGEAGLARQLQEEEDRVAQGGGGEGGSQAGAAGPSSSPATAAATGGAPKVEPPRPIRKWPAFHPDDAHLSYLPLAHIYERALVEGAFALGAGIGFWQVRAAVSELQVVGA
jgi:hypothetical protein